MITTIIFDLSEVYLHGMQGIERKIEKLLGIKIPTQIYIEKESDQFFKGEITEEEFWRKIIKKKHWKIDIHTLKRLVREGMTEIEGTREIIERLKKNGYTLGLLSVHSKEWAKHCEKQFEYRKLFHSIMYSFEIGVCKPDPKAFELMIKKLKVDPRECLFTDDYIENIKAAKRLGMQAIQFKNAKQLERELSKYKIRLT
jgi:putative hydrolase of the HAD superfamily